MGFGGRFFSKLFKSQEDDFYNLELDEGIEEEFEWDWDHIIEERQLFKMSDDVQREKYLRNLVEQVRDAEDELNKLSAEYNAVTAMLKDGRDRVAPGHGKSRDLRCGQEHTLIRRRGQEL